MKIFVLILMFFILFALAGSLLFLVKDEGKTQRTVKGLTLRIALSLLLFFLLLFSYTMGWLTPHSFY